jgi:hypothetical protein
VIPVIPTKLAAAAFIFIFGFNDSPSEAYRKNPYGKRDLAHILKKIRYPQARFWTGSTAKGGARLRDA